MMLDLLERMWYNNVITTKGANHHGIHADAQKSLCGTD